MMLKEFQNATGCCWRLDCGSKFQGGPVVATELGADGSSHAAVTATDLAGEPRVATISVIWNYPRGERVWLGFSSPRPSFAGAQCKRMKHSSPIAVCAECAPAIRCKRCLRRGAGPASRRLRGAATRIVALLPGVIFSRLVRTVGAGRPVGDAAVTSRFAVAGRGIGRRPEARRTLPVEESTVTDQCSSPLGRLAQRLPEGPSVHRNRLAQPPLRAGALGRIGDPKPAIRWIGPPAADADRAGCGRRAGFRSRSARNGQLRPVGVECC